MDKPMIAVLDNHDQLLCLTEEYFDSNLHRFLEGTAAFFACSVIQTDEIAQYFKVGNKISFVRDEIDYHFDITNAKRTEKLVTIQSDSLTLELRNEDASEYKATKAMSFAEYLNVFLFKGDNPIIVGINEVSDKKIQAEWTGNEDSTLKRLFSLANKFDAEIEFVTVLNKHWGLDHVTLNVYRAHSDKYQGVGKMRQDVILEYGNNVETVEVEENIDDLKTAIHATGTDGLTPKNVVIDEKDANGNQLFESKKGETSIRAVQAKEQFKSKMNGEGYIAKNWTYETTNENVLAGQALAELKKLCEPKVTVTIKGYEELGIGDTVRVQNTGYVPTLNLLARISEQDVYFEDPSKNTSTFTNVEILQSAVDQSLLDRVNILINQNKIYQCSVISSGPVTFKNSTGSTTLTADVRDGVQNVTDEFIVTWFKDGTQISVGKSITVKASDISGNALYYYEITKDGALKGRADVTVTNVDDGQGKDGVSPIVTINNDSSLTIVDAEGSKKTDKLKGSDGKTPIKGVDYDDGKDGYTPIKGVDYFDGKPGAAGKSAYLWIRYSKNANGNPMVALPTSETIYIGYATTETATAPTDHTKYTWQKVQGPQGVPGETVNGKTSYLHIKYSNDGGKTFTGNNGETAGSWIGQYVDFTQADSNKVTDYTWAKVTGDNGKTPVIHTAYKMADETFTREWPRENLLLNSDSPEAFLLASNDISKYSIEYGVQEGVDWVTGKMLDTGEFYLSAYVRNTFIPDEFGKTYSNELKDYTGELSFSVEVMSKVALDVLLSPNSVGNRTTLKPNEWTRLTYNGAKNAYRPYFPRAVDNPEAPVGTKLYWRNYKLEKGSTATPYTSSDTGDPNLLYPKWVGTYADYSETGSTNPDDYNWTIEPRWLQAMTDKGLADKVEQDQYDADKSETWEEIGNRVTMEEAQEIREIAQSVLNSYNTFTSNGGQYQKDLEALESRTTALVQKLGDQLATYEFLQTYIKLGEEGISVGSDDSSMKILVSKDKISFTDGGQVTAYFSNQSFLIRSGAIVDDFQIGEFKWDTSLDRHLLLQYVG